MSGEDENDLPFPVAVFLDTNILDGLHETLQSGELSSLVELAGKVHITDITAREWIAHRFDKARKSFVEASASARHLKQYSEEWVTTKPPKLFDLYERVRRTSLKRIRAVPLRIVPPPRLNRRDLCFRSSMKIPPFRDEGRGFKDEMVILGMLKHLSHWNYKTAMLVSKDHDFIKGTAHRFEQIGLKFRVVKTIPEAKALIEKGLTEAQRGELEKLEESAMDFVNSQLKAVNAAVEKLVQTEGLSDWLIRDAAKYDGPGGSFDARQLVAVLPLRVKNVSVGNLHEASGRTLLTIDVECELTLEGVFVSHMGYYMRKLVLGKEPEPAKYSPPERGTKTVKDSVRLEATARRVDGQWSDLQFIDSGEWYKLQREINPALDKW